MLTLATAALLVGATPSGAGELGVGDVAPKLEVGNWVKGEPIADFRADHTYVVEFWATWCPPCRKSIPHLSKLQEKYGDRITVIGVSIWEDDFSAVAPFVEKMGDRMGYHVATDLMNVKDQDGVMARSWMRAAGLKSIPTAFIVREGVVNWIGSPFAMDDPLKKIVAGKWDLAAEVERTRRAREREAKVAPFNETLNKALYAKKWTVALEAISEILAIIPEREVDLGGLKFECLIRLEAFDRAYAYGREFVDGKAWNESGALNYVAWTIVDPETEVKKKDLDLALRAAKRADDLTKNENPAILDTLAKVYFDLGKIEKAIELQSKAVELAEGTSLEGELRSRLEQYERVD